MVVNIRTKEKNGYEAFQLRFGEKKRKADFETISWSIQKKRN